VSNRVTKKKYDGSAADRGSVMARLRQRKQKRSAEKKKEPEEDCIILQRTQVCAVTDTSPGAGTTGPSVVPGFVNEDFLTQYWVWGDRYKQGKGIVNVGSIEPKYFETEFDLLKEGNVHKIVPGRVCGRGREFQINHYAGNEAQRTFRDAVDPRGGYEGGVSRPVNPSPDQCLRLDAPREIRPWLQGFVDAVGVEEAQRLLEGAGRVDSWPPYSTTIKG